MDRTLYTACEYKILHVLKFTHIQSTDSQREDKAVADSQPRASLTHPPEAGGLLERESRRLIYARLFRKVKLQGSRGVPGVLHSVIVKRDLSLCPHPLPAQAFQRRAGPVPRKLFRKVRGEGLEAAGEMA